MTKFVTTDYEMFKIIEKNREILRGPYEKLKKSILEKNCLKEKPILVDKDFRVLDGQHRLAIARDLDLPIYYEISESVNESDMHLLQTQTAWKPKDFLRYYAKGGNENYAKLEKFMEKTGLDLSHALLTLEGPTFLRNKSITFVFNKGKFVFPDTHRVNAALSNLEKINVFLDFICQKTPEHKAMLGTSTLKRALLFFFNMPNVDFDEFMKKLELKLHLFHHCSRYQDYLKIFETIYNFRRREPISVAKQFFGTEDV